MSGASTAGLPADATIVDGVVEADVAIIGAGAAGLQAAACLVDDLDIVIVDKAGPTATSGSSPWAQGGIAAAVTAEDSPAAHVADTLAASDGLADPTAAWVLATEAPSHVGILLAHGAAFDRVGDDPAAPLAPALEGGQRHARSVRRGDASGAELIRVLRRLAVGKASRLTGVVDRLVTGRDGRVLGAWVVVDGHWVALRATTTILATGGCGGLFAATTNPVHATGDGLALAAAAGARLRDVEFVQFHPTALAVGSGHHFLLTEALRGAGATLHDRDGNRFMLDVHPDAELAPRHVVAGAILALPDATAFLDATALGAQRLTEEFPTVAAGTAERGFDLATQRVPVTPAAHYHMGGVWTDLGARTSLPGLLAAGEVACTGIHGANRMAGNSLSEALVFGARAAASALDDCTRVGAPPSPPQDSDADTTGLSDDVRSPMSWSVPAMPMWSGPDDAAEVLANLRRRMLVDAGPHRHGDRLQRLLADIDTWRAGMSSRPAIMPCPPRALAALALRHALEAARLIVRSASLRTESRGGHHRVDHPGHESAWQDVHLDIATAPDGLTSSDEASSRDAH